MAILDASINKKKEKMMTTKKDEKWQLIMDNFEQCQKEHEKLLQIMSLIYNKVARFEDDEEFTRRKMDFKF